MWARPHPKNASICNTDGVGAVANAAWADDLLFVSGTTCLSSLEQPVSHANYALLHSILKGDSPGLLLFWLEQLCTQDLERGRKRAHGATCCRQRRMHCHAQRSELDQLPAYGLYILDFSDGVQCELLSARVCFCSC